MAIAIHEGKLLADYIATQGIDKDEICSRLNITDQAWSYHVSRTNLSSKFKAKLLASGISLFEDEKHEHQFVLEYNKELEEKISMLNEVIDLQKQFITHVTKNCRNGNCLNFVLEKRNHKEHAQKIKPLHF